MPSVTLQSSPCPRIALYHTFTLNTAHHLRSRYLRQSLSSKPLPLGTGTIHTTPSITVTHCPLSLAHLHSRCIQSPQATTTTFASHHLSPPDCSHAYTSQPLTQHPTINNAFWKSTPLIISRVAVQRTFYRKTNPWSLQFPYINVF